MCDMQLTLIQIYSPKIAFSQSDTIQIHLKVVVFIDCYRKEMQSLRGKHIHWKKQGTKDGALENTY